MSIERELLFSNGEAYNINDTINNLFDAVMGGLIQEGVYNQIIGTLISLRFGTYVDYNTFILDPASGVYVPLDIWLTTNGVIDVTFFSFGGELEGEAIISDEEEEILAASSFFDRVLTDDDLLVIHEDELIDEIQVIEVIDLTDAEDNVSV